MNNYGPIEFFATLFIVGVLVHLVSQVILDNRRRRNAAARRPRPNRRRQ